MAFWNRSKPAYNRTQILESAEKARSRGRTRKAIAEYRKILAVDPKDAQVNARIAPLLFKMKKHDEAGKAFEAAASSFIEKGFVDKALAVYSQAATLYPLDVRIWIRLADLHEERGRKADAVNALLQGAEHLRRQKSTRSAAARMLERALRIDPLNVQATIAFARMLAKDGRKRDALDRLEALASQVGGTALKRVRGAQLRLSPTPAALWRWLRAGAKRAPSNPPRAISGKPPVPRRP